LISVIIPTFNEADSIMPSLHRLNGGDIEVILADSPDSYDNLEKLAVNANCHYLKTQKSGRNHQMNEGAEIAKGDVLYFVHADVLVHPDFISDIKNAISQGADLGCYRYVFDQYTHPLLYINSFFTRFPMIWCRGGDQTLFIKKSVFETLNGFCKEQHIMEDYDILLRSKGKYNFQIIPKNVIVSSRKYIKNGYYAVQKANLIVMRKYLRKEAKPVELQKLYKKLLKN
jgi:glycosyltransferase involved in cell wall biosynthesis